MARRSVSAEHLHRIPVQSGAWQAESASVFPYFDDTGAVTWLMLVAPDSPDIFFLRNKPGHVQTQVDGAIIECLPQRWEDLDLTDQSEIAALLHYDPWWVLAEKRFQGHEAVPILKATNIVELFADNPPNYSPDLMNVEGKGRQGLSTRERSSTASDNAD